jgi:hypothetical protein
MDDFIHTYVADISPLKTISSVKKFDIGQGFYRLDWL